LQLRSLRDRSDDFQYEIVVARTLEEAVLAVLANPCIEACVLRFSFPFEGGAHHAIEDRMFFLLGQSRERIAAIMPGERTELLGRLL
jgi:arginine decarboxylase